MRGWIRSIEPGVLILAALGLLLLPMRWVAAFLLAAVFHELCHLLAVWLCRGQVRGFTAGVGGVILRAEGLSRGQLLFCTLAGPMGSFLLLPLGRWIPALAVCGLVQAVCNLLPLGTLDGAQALEHLCCLFLQPRTAWRICRAAECLCIAGVCAMAILLRWGIVPLALILFACYRRKTEKSLAN